MEFIFVGTQCWVASIRVLEVISASLNESSPPKQERRETFPSQSLSTQRVTRFVSPESKGAGKIVTRVSGPAQVSCHTDDTLPRKQRAHHITMRLQGKCHLTSNTAFPNKNVYNLHSAAFRNAPVSSPSSFWRLVDGVANNDKKADTETVVFDLWNHTLCVQHFFQNSELPDEQPCFNF